MDDVYDDYAELAQVLERYWAVWEEIKAFLSEQKTEKSFWKMWRRCKLHFVANITSHLNELNIELEG